MAAASNDISYFVVDCENEEIIDEGTIHSDTSDLLPLSYLQAFGSGYSQHSSFITQLIKDGNYVYFPTGYFSNPNWTDPVFYVTTGFKKINIVSQGDQTSIPFNANKTGLNPITRAGNLIITSGRVINGGVGYTCGSQFSTAYTMVFQETNKVSSLVFPIGTGLNLQNGTYRHPYKRRQVSQCLSSMLSLRLTLINEVVYV